MPFIERIHDWIVQAVFELPPNIKAAVLRLLLFYLIAAILMTISRRYWKLRSRGFQALLLMTSFFCAMAINLDIFDFSLTPAYCWFFLLACGAIFVLPVFLSKLIVPTEGGQRKASLILYIVTAVLFGIEFLL